MMTLGLKNNNPFNIVYNPINKWIGLDGHVGRFCKFKSLNLGLRAGFVLVRNYIRSGYDTPSKILNKYAPPSENFTSDYINYVCTYGLKPTQVIKYPSDDFVRLCIAICKYESEYNLTPAKVYNLLSYYRV